MSWNTESTGCKIVIRHLHHSGKSCCSEEEGEENLWKWMNQLNFPIQRKNNLLRNTQPTGDHLTSAPSFCTGEHSSGRLRQSALWAVPPRGSETPAWGQGSWFGARCPSSSKARGPRPHSENCIYSWKKGFRGVPSLLPCCLMSITTSRHQPEEGNKDESHVFLMSSENMDQSLLANSALFSKPAPACSSKFDTAFCLLQLSLLYQVTDYF